MTMLQEHLFISKEIPGLDNPEVIDVLQPTIQDLRAYFEKRDQMIREQELAFDQDMVSEEQLTDLELMLLEEVTPNEAVILRNGDVLIGSRLSLHILDLDGTDLTDTVEEPRAQLARLAEKLRVKDVTEKFPIVTATTYPKLARLAHHMIGMEYAAATYFPATSHAADLLLGIHELSNNARARSKLPPTDKPEIESLVMYTQDFIDQFSR